MTYYLGLDMGTNSVGWAVTDENYTLMRFKGKDMWGIREFDEALPALERRTHRINRRRLQRKKVRLNLLRTYFADEIIKIDDSFFERLDNSKYLLEDKDENVRTKSVIFNNSDYKDADYYKDYPTVFHLRKELIDNPEPHDVRMVYLAVSNMFKHRGNFLVSSLGIAENTDNMRDMYLETADKIAEEFGIILERNIEFDDFENLLGGREYSRSRKMELLCEMLGIKNSDKRKKAFIKCLCGLNVRLSELIDEKDIELSDEDKKFSFGFSDGDYEEKILQLEEKIGESKTNIISELKLIHDRTVVAEIMKNQKSLSHARVELYDKHAKDLKLLKRVLKKYLSAEVYDCFFRSEEGGTYSAYVNSYNSGDKSRRNYKGRKQEELYKSIKNMLKSVEPDEDIIYIMNEIEKETFLPKQLTFRNGVIPNQIHMDELKKILSNAENYLPFLKKRDESGLSISEKIVKLFEFRIPYYVGPVSEKGNGWVVRKESGTIFPWNIESKIDTKKTSEEFIIRMVRECTYISGEKVMPKASLTYEKYKVLNEINNIKIDGEKIDVKLKQDIYKELFLKGKRVTRKQIFNLLYTRGIVEEDSQISGIDKVINNSLSTYGKFINIFGKQLKEDKYKEAVDDIVFLSTVYGDSKKFLKEKIEEKYSDIIDDGQIKRILGFKFRDWGNLSAEFLNLQGCNKETGEVMSLLTAMWETNCNLMELINSDKFTYKEELKNKCKKTVECLSEYTIDDLNQEYFSAPVKRMVWQTLSIIKEIEKIMKIAPDKIFIEMTRNDDIKGDKGRKDSRKNQLIDLYRQIRSEDAQWKKEKISKIEKFDEDGSLRSKKLYLYFTQKGLDMYTGNPIDLDDLLSANSRYDIDHIYPRHFVKDDSINNNLVLASKQANAEKSDKYPIKNSIYQSMKYIWKGLRDENLITEEKYKRLIGRSKFTDEQKAGFIARQLVETSQGTKGVADLLKSLLPETKIIYSKAANVSEFRHKYNLPKSRLINDFHHANDAYLNIVVGNIYYTKFTQNPINFIKKEYKSGDSKFEYNLSKMYEHDVIREGKTAWIAQSGNNSGTILTVKRMLAKNTPILTRLAIERHGKIADATLHSHKKAKVGSYIPIKATDAKLLDVKKYGGYSSVKAAYIFMVEGEFKGKKVRTLETVPLYMKEKLEKSQGALEEYCKTVLGYTNPSVRVRKIKFQSLIKYNGYYMNISNKTNKRFEVRNYVQLCLGGEWKNYIHKLEKYQNYAVLDDAITNEKNIKLFDILSEKHRLGIFSRRPNSVGQKIVEGRDKFVKLDLEKQIEVLVQIIGLTAAEIVKADLKLIGAPANGGVMTISKNITDAKECILINQSVTGLYENRIDLLKV